jgi:hypothetical protein
LATLERVWQNVVPLLALCLALYAVLSVEARSVQVGQLAVENTHRIDDIARLTRESQRTTKAVCALRADLKRRVTNSWQFLKKNPRGFFGFSAKELRASIRNQRRTIRSLRVASCK